MVMVSMYGISDPEILNDEITRSLLPVLLDIVHEYAQPQRLYPFRNSPTLPKEMWISYKDVKTVEEFTVFLRKHHLTAKDFDRPFAATQQSLFAHALCRQNLKLIQFMIEERQKSFPFLPWRKHKKEYGNNCNDNELPAPNLLYSAVSNWFRMHFHGSLLQTHLVLRSDSETWLNILDFILTQAPDLVNLSECESPLYLWLHMVFDLPEIILNDNVMATLRRLIEYGAMFISEIDQRSNELEILERTVVKQYFESVWCRAQSGGAPPSQESIFKFEFLRMPNSVDV